MVVKVSGRVSVSPITGFIVGEAFIIPFWVLPGELEPVTQDLTQDLSKL